MSLSVTKTPLPGVLILEPKVHGDDRGYFFEGFNERDFSAAIGEKVKFVQDNQSKSAHRILRGMHYQVGQPQGKLVRVLNGVIFDAVIDLRANSRTFRHWFGIELSEQNKRQIWVPAGFAHGFLVRSTSAEVLYKTTDYWSATHERFLRWNDPTIGIDWGTTEGADDAPILAARDAQAPLLADAEIYL